MSCPGLSPRRYTHPSDQPTNRPNCPGICPGVPARYSVTAYVNKVVSELVIGCYFYLRSYFYDLLWWSYDEVTTKLWQICDYFYDHLV